MCVVRESEVELRFVCLPFGMMGGGECGSWVYMVEEASKNTLARTVTRNVCIRACSNGKHEVVGYKLYSKRAEEGGHVQ